MFDVKFYLNRKAKLVAIAGKQKFDPLVESYFAGKVEIESVRLEFFLCILNQLVAYTDDRKNEFLHGITHEMS